MKVEKLEKLRGKLEEIHYKTVNVFESHELVIEGKSYKETPFSLLMDLIVYFISEFRRGGKIEFKIWRVGRNLKLLVKVVHFFISLYKYYFPEDKEDSELLFPNSKALSINFRSDHV